MATVPKERDNITLKNKSLTVLLKCGFVDTGLVTTCPYLEIGGDKEVKVHKLTL